MNSIKTAIVGGGAAGFFLALHLKEKCPSMEVTIFERSSHLLRKVKVSGGGRCNCTNTFADVSDLSSVYPRGHRLMKRLLKGFSQHDAYAWFEHHGIPLTVQPDHCVFPAAQDAQVVIDCFLHHARRLGVIIRTGCPVTAVTPNPSAAAPALTLSLADAPDERFDFVALTTGGQPRMENLQPLAHLGHAIEAPVPSLFTFSIDDPALHALMGTVVDYSTDGDPSVPNVIVGLPGTKFRASGAILITHWGLSGPAILKLSSYAARYLAEQGYCAPLTVNWTGQNEEQVQQHLLRLLAEHPRRQITTFHPFNLPTRLWSYLLEKAQTSGNYDITPTSTPLSLSKRAINRLVALLTADIYTIASRAPFKDEFVTCGGIALSAVNPSTLESRHCPHLYFAGELLDIDGITGGFNFQAAWTTAYTAATAIAQAASSKLYDVTLNEPST